MTDPTDSRRRLPARSAFLQTRKPGRRAVILDEDPDISPEHLPQTSEPSANPRSPTGDTPLKE